MPKTAATGFEVVLHGTYQAKASNTVMQYVLDIDDPVVSKLLVAQNFLTAIADVAGTFMPARRNLASTAMTFQKWTLRGFGTVSFLIELPYAAAVAGLQTGEQASRQDAISFRSILAEVGARRAMHRLGGLTETMSANGVLTSAVLASANGAMSTEFGKGYNVSDGTNLVTVLPASVPRVLDLNGNRVLPMSATFDYYDAVGWSAAPRVSTQNTRKGDIHNP